MSDLAIMPKKDSRPRNWRLELRAPEGQIQNRTIADARLHSADAGWIKFQHLDGRVAMFATVNVLSAIEERDP